MLDARQEAQLQKLLANYKLTPMTLHMRLHPHIIPAPFLMYLSATIAHTIAKGNGRIIISLPPRHGKSELITKATPIWTLENYGQKNVVVCSYGGDLSSDFGRKVRDIIKDNSDLLDVRIRQDAQRVNNWLTNFGGAMYSVGLGGPITGRGADVLIIDDYIKEIKEAQSQVMRDYIWDWFVTTAFTRLEPGATCIIVATRWHHDDLIGRILKNRPGRHPWNNIVIPAFAEPPEGYDTDFLGRHQGEVLFPQRYPAEDLDDRKSTLGSFHFNALFQQRPENDMGKLTDKRWLKYAQHYPIATADNQVKYIRVWDLAATEDGGDYAVGTLMAYEPKKDHTTILDIKRVQFGPKAVERLLRETAEADGKNIDIGIEREPGSSGKLLVQNYANNLLKGWRVHEIPANDNKLYRAQPFLAAVEAGRVSLLQVDPNAPTWQPTFADEYDDFPGGEHDDQVDTAAAGYTFLSGKKLLRASWGRDPKDQTQDQNQTQQTQELIMPNGDVINMTNNYVEPKPIIRSVSWGR